MKTASLLFVLLSSLLNAQQRETMRTHPGIIPTPQVSVEKETEFKFTSVTRIVLGDGATKEDRFAAEQLNAALREFRNTDLKIVREEELHKLTANFVFLGPPKGELARRFTTERKLTLRPEMKQEGYDLDVDRDGIVIIGESATGRFHGVMSLLQILERKKKSVVVEGMSVRDWPLQSVRGITDDLSRNQVSTMDNFKKIIRFLARYKLNVYSPYIEDIFTFKSQPLIGRGRGSLTAAEVKELDSYAHAFHVQLIPIFETLGHWENILAMPEYVQYAEFPGAHTLNISDERIYPMLDEMIGELSAAFSSPYFNMAADESWDVGLGANRERVAKSDLASVHAEHYNRLFEILSKYKKKPMMYGDIILNNPAILDKIPRDVTIVDWHYAATDAYASPKIFCDAGFPFIVSPAVWNFTGPFPNYLNTFANVQILNREGYTNGSLGLLTSNWNDYGGEALRELNYVGYGWTAECAWNPLRAAIGAFSEKFFRDFFGNEEAALAARSAYAMLSDPANQINWNELWRHPFLPLRVVQFPYVVRIQSLRSTMPLVTRYIEQLHQSATRNKDQAEYLAFIVRTNTWFAKKLEASEAIRTLTQTPSPGATVDSIKAVVTTLCDRVAGDLQRMQEEFKGIWLATNRSDNLELLMKRYDRQLAYWNEKKEEVQRNLLWVDPQIESRFIYHPNGNSRRRDTTLAQVPTAYFRKSFVLDDTATTALLQLIGDTYATLWVNGNYTGEVYVRPSLSLSIEYQRVKLFDIARYLRKGENVIAVKSQSFGPFSSAGCNVYAEIGTRAGTAKVCTDSTWRANAVEVAGWKTPGFADSTWSASKPAPYPVPVVRPNLASRRTSWLER